MDVKIAQDWKQLLQTEFDKPYFEELTHFVRAEYAAGTVFPAGKNIWPIRKCYSYSLANTPSPLKVSYPNFKLRSQKNIRLEETPPGMIFSNICVCF